MMFVLNSHHWIQKCLLPRHAGAVVSTMRQIRLETYIKSDRHQDMSLRRTFPHQSLGVTNLHTSAGVCRDLLKKMLTNKRKKKWYKAPQVSLLADYTVCRIYWKTSLSSDQDSQIQQILDKCAPRIRYLLISQQILGSVPPLVFILDKQYAALKEVENLLNIADYGPSDDSENLVLNGKDAETSVHTVEKKRFVFGIDHDALYKQIEDYKQRSSSSSSEISNSASLTQEQLDTLAEIRKQKLVEKKKRKAKKLKDDDITPKEFLLMRQLQKEQDEQYRTEYDTEDSQASERT
ncbi:putative ribosome-binding factor A, mitochondrial isoform X2 [Neoarius graeffei]|uniref:putative ribosome-binding factor A, mitochondrial isoform X2 n=1 Tax=Neoarius graeffei TaxID=443677 RepID=UPI00298D4492|nr:putative ribosome-binding factor A, mitochondrial isoform X2 [Neoarius graeffei]